MIDLKPYLVVLFLGLAVVACGSTKKNLERPELGMSVLASEVEGRETVLRFDLNGDGKPDVWKTLLMLSSSGEDGGKDKQLLVKKQLDINFDGLVDITKFYNQGGMVEREEMDLDFDKAVDVVHFYREGLLYMSEYDMAFDGGTDLWKYYDDGKLVRKERDVNGDSQIDSWEYFKEGKLIRVGKDRDGDGDPEYFEDVPGV